MCSCNSYLCSSNCTLFCLGELAALPRPAGWILGRQGEGEKGGARERGEKSGRRKEGKGRGGKEKEPKGRRRGNEGKERKGREEAAGRSFVQLRFVLRKNPPAVDHCRHTATHSIVVRNGYTRMQWDTIQYKICKAPCCRGFRGTGKQDS